SIPWNEQGVNGSKFPNNGYATYAAEVILPVDMDEISIQVPAFFNSYSLWINDELICSNGTVGMSRADEVPEWRPQSVSVKLRSNVMHIVFHISNFQDTRGGAAQAIKISKGTALISAEVRDNVIGSIMFLVFSAVGLLGVVAYYISRQRNILYFSLVAIAFAIRFLFSDMYLYYDLMPFAIPWNIAVRIEYATVPFVVAWSALFVSGKYPNEFRKSVKVFFILTSTLFIILTALVGFKFISQLLLIIQVTTLAFLVYTIVAIINAMLDSRVGAWTSALGLAICVSVGFYNIAILLSGGELNRLIIYGGYTTALILNALSLLYRTDDQIAKEKRNRLSYSDFYLDSDN
ncbi:MAG: 7TM diverse intracellular signaling domain-containing protein, partial [Cyclobacteriaceae bacterium]